MQVSMFHLMPYRDLPKDFEQRYHSVWVDPPWWELADADKVGQYYNWTLDELVYAARSGLDGICTNEHHQNAYGFMPNPNLMGSALAKATNGLDVAVVQMGSTLPTTNPPIRVAEEYAMLDCISGGRLVAGMPLGSPMDVNYCYGVPPMEQRERYREAHDLIVKAWTAKEMFAWNGKYWQLPMVNPWPRPIQQPHPPIWVPGSGSITTWDFAADHDYCYCFLSYFGWQMAQGVVDGYWARVQEKGKDMNPYRLGFLQLVVVSETDARAEEEYAEHVEYFYHKCLHIAPEFAFPPGHHDWESLVHMVRRGGFGGLSMNLREMGYRDFVNQGCVIAGSPETVRDQLREMAKRLRVGNLMVLLHIGSMPHELTLKNIDLFAREVLPHIRDIWDDEGWENHWWPQRLRKPQPATR
ncbi:2,5-diketocamphane 1,2-monooxygenase [bacterium HR24]|jgi:alkanesulfonate monooxygenase SsuD/methylene tetrahydromethanopterin reductase-like flavin-dependent oxidoreductase (luciferase family)|nr:2,5-diketocamphane 1,2-monooxygenase [bacterium HR24]